MSLRDDVVFVSCHALNANSISVQIDNFLLNKSDVTGSFQCNFVRAHEFTQKCQAKSTADPILVLRLKLSHVALVRYHALNANRNSVQIRRSLAKQVALLPQFLT